MTNFMIVAHRRWATIIKFKILILNKRTKLMIEGLYLSCKRSRPTEYRGLEARSLKLRLHKCSFVAVPVVSLTILTSDDLGEDVNNKKSNNN